MTSTHNSTHKPRDKQTPPDGRRQEGRENIKAIHTVIIMCRRVVGSDRAGLFVHRPPDTKPHESHHHNVAMPQSPRVGKVMSNDEKTVKSAIPPTTYHHRTL